MKRNILVLIGLVVILVVVILLQKKPSTNPIVVQSGQPIPQASNGTYKPATYVAPKAPAKSSTDYATYINNLGIATNKCNVTAKDQFTKLYPSLEGGAFKSSYNETTGGCYITVTGKSRAPYATTTVAHIIFRNVYQSSVVAECVDTKGVTYGDEEWTCTEKASGKTMSIPEFNGLIYKYIAK